MKDAAVAALATAIAAGPALADCPVLGDMDRGVRFTIDTGETEAFRRTGENMVEAILDYGDGEGMRNLLARGLYLVELVDLKDGRPVMGTRGTFTFAVPPAEMAPPEPGGEWRVPVSSLLDGTLATEEQVYRFGAPRNIAYGDCAYDVIPVEILYPDSSDTRRRDLLHYLPALGLSYLAEFHDKDGSDIYTYQTIEVLE